MMEAMTLERPLTVDQVADLYGVTREAVYRWLRDGKLAARRIDGKSYGVTWTALRRFDATLPVYKRKLQPH